MEATQVTIMTADQLKEFAAEVVRNTLAEGGEATGGKQNVKKRFVYGIRGISELFRVSIPTAQKYKNTFLAPAISQRGRKVVTDVDKAWELYNERKNA